MHACMWVPATRDLCQSLLRFTSWCVGVTGPCAWIPNHYHGSHAFSLLRAWPTAAHQRMHQLFNCMLRQRASISVGVRHSMWSGS